MLPITNPWNKIQALVKSFEVKWIRYLAFGKLPNNSEDNWIGFSHKPDSKKISNITFLGTPETKIEQFVIIKNINNVFNED